MSDLPADTELKEKILSTEIEDLNLSIRSYNSLKRSGINSLSQIIDLGEDWISRIRNLGKQQLDEIFDTTAAFLGVSRVSLIQLTTTPKIQETTQVDPIPEVETPLQAEKPPQIEKIFPPQDTRPLIIEIDLDNLPNLVEIIVPFSKKLMEVLEYEREFEVLKRRFGLEGSKTYTLQDIGNYYDLTRERVRQIEVHATTKIKRVLLGISRLPRQRIPQNLIDEANEFLDLLQSKDTILTEQELIQITEERYKFKISPQKLNYLRLLLGVFEFRPLPRSLAGTGREFVPAWIIADNVQTEPLFQAAKVIARVIHNSAAPISSFDLRVQLNSKRKKQIEGKYIGLAVKLFPEIEPINKDNFQIKFEYLPSLADQSYRILFESGKPIHFRDIQRQINHHLAKVGRPADARIRTIVGQLVSDSRFEAIGRSGIWSLAEWEDVHRSTIVELMQEFFHIKQARASTTEVYDYVSTKRADVPKQSIRTYLSSHEAFVRVDKNLYELSAWGAKPGQSIERISAEEIQKLLIPATKEIFNDTPGTSMPLSRLTRELVTRTGIPESTIYFKLRQSPMIRFEDDPTSKSKKKKKKIAYYVGDIQKPVSKPVSSTLRRRIKEEVIQYLQRQPNRKSSVVELSAHLKKTTGAKKATTYQYLSKMEDEGDIRKEYEGRNLYCYLASAEVYETPIALSFPQIEDVKDVTLKGNLVRCIKNFNIDNIDMGLFQLGKIFESELKAFLTEAQGKDKYTITGKDLTRLISMIDCVERNGIIAQKHHLTLLREQRNERAHGEIPDLEERKKLMQHAPFLGDLYIKYILFFNEQRKSL